MCAAAYPLWLGWLGAFLARQDGPEKAEMIVVLAGDQFGNRIEKACDLLREGYAPSVLVSGPCCYYGIVESDAAVEFAAKKGCPADRLISFPVKARNTVDEAAELKNSQIAEELALPPVKIHCSILAEDAIKAAVEDYKKKHLN